MATPSNESKCDNHPDKQAQHKVTGEVDSFGYETRNLCEDCFKERNEAQAEPAECDLCGTITELKRIRDPEEGMSGPVYYCCKACAIDLKRGFVYDEAEIADDDSLDD